MRKELFLVCIPVLLAIAAGCVSVNSEKSADRLAAVKAITDEDELFAVIGETRYSDARNAAASRIRREDLSLRLVRRNDLDDSTRLILVGNVRDSSELKRLVFDQSFPTSLRAAALKGIADEPTLVECAENIEDEQLQNDAAARISNEENCKTLVVRDDIFDSSKTILLGKISDAAFLGTIVEDRDKNDVLRKSALSGIKAENVCRDLLGVRPPLESWVWEHAIPRVSDSAVLADAAATREAPDSVRKIALSRIDDDSQFLRLLQINPPLEDWVREKAVPRVSDQPTLISVFQDKAARKALRELALARIKDESALLSVVKDQNDDDAVRRAALNVIRNEDSAKDLLETIPVLEKWICARAVSLVSDRETLSEVFLDPRFDDEVRLAAGNKIADPDKTKELFLASSDDLAAAFALNRMEEVDFKSDAAQQRLLNLFRATSDVELMTKAWSRLKPETDFCRSGDQHRIVSMLKADADGISSDRMLANIFDDSCILDLGLANNERLAESAIRLRPNPSTALQIAERAAFPSIQCMALSLLDEESGFARIAKSGPSRVVRITAISRLSSASAGVLSELTGDADPVVSETAVRKLKTLGRSDAVAAAERKAEAARKAEEEKAKAEQRAREERERRAEQELAERGLQVLADAQIHSFRHYLEVLEKYPDIGEKTFRFSGRVVRADGRRLSLSVPHAGGGTFTLEIKLLEKPSRRPEENGIVTVSGRYKKGTQQSAELEKGTIVCFGIPSGPSAEVEKRIRERAAIQGFAETQVRTFRQYLERRESDSRTKKETFQFTGIVKAVKYSGRELSLSVPSDGGETFVVGIEMSEKPTFDVEFGSVLTVSGRYRNGTRQTAELDKGSIVSVGVPK